jgi:cytochrome oxidase assembly protein ShyY1
MLEKLYQVRKAKDKQLIREYEKRLTTEPVSTQELFVNNNISQKGIDVK